MFTFRRKLRRIFVFGMKDLKYIKYRTIKEKVDKYFSA